MTHDIIMAIVEIFGIFAIGWLARWRGYLQEKELRRWSQLVLDILFPLLVFNSIIGGLDVNRLGQLWPLPAIGLGMIVFGALAGVLLRRGLVSRDRDLTKTFHHFCAINNYTLLPIIIIGRLWGEAGLANLFLLNLGSTVGYWTVGVALLGEFDAGRTLRKLVTPTLVALLAAIGLAVSGWGEHVPTIVLRIAGRVGGAAVPCMLILVGATLYPLPKLKDKRDLAYLTFVRLALLPAVLVAVLWVAPISEDVRNVSLIVALMPASVMSTVLTRRYGGDPAFAARAAVVTTILAAFTVPLALDLLGRFGW